MKKTYQKPGLFIEVFIANEYVATCGIHSGSSLYLDYATEKDASFGTKKYESGPDGVYQASVKNLGFGFWGNLIAGIFGKDHKDSEKLGTLTKKADTSGWDKISASSGNFYYGTYADNDHYNGNQSVTGSIYTNGTNYLIVDPNRPNRS